MFRNCWVLLICLILLAPLAAEAHDDHPVETAPAGSESVDGATTTEGSETTMEKVADWFSAGGFGLYRQNYAVFSRGNDQTSGSDTELKFQLSFKQEIGKSGLNAAYTQKSFWRIFDGADSRPFRETNYSPELFWRVPEDWIGNKAITLDLGLFQHESNGMTEPTSRSWDRSYVRGAWDFGMLDAELKIWHRWSEDVKKFKDDPAGDENPDITDFYGYSEFRLGLDLCWDSYLRLMARRNFSTSKGAVQVDFSMPISKSNVLLYAQFWDGYGESLIDYNKSLTKYGFGLRIAGMGQN